MNKITSALSIGFVLVLAACSNEAINGDTSNSGGSGSGGDDSSGNGAGAGDSSGNGNPSTASGNPTSGAGNSTASGNPTGGSGDSCTATDSYRFVFPGSPPGSQAHHRYMMGSPMQPGDLSPDNGAKFKPWPDQEAAPGLDTWRDFGGGPNNKGLVDSSAALDVTKAVCKGLPIRFQGYDATGNTIAYGCDNTTAFNGLRVWKNGNACSFVRLSNDQGGSNCQTTCE